MLRIDRSILDTSDVICGNISELGSTSRGLLSQNLLGQLRNFVEYIAIKIYSGSQDVDPNDYPLRKAALKDLRSRGDLRFLYKFHEMLQKSVSHYTIDGDGSERLMLKYYEYLLRLKTYLKQTFNMDVLENVSEFPLYTDNELFGYYEAIAESIRSPSVFSSSVVYVDRYYVQKVKPFFVHQRVYYEVTFTIANANASKFDRVIAFTQHEIVDNYAVKLWMHDDVIHVLNRDMAILVIDNYEVSIRPCEWENFSRILDFKLKCNTNSYEYKELMRFLVDTKMSLSELVGSDQAYYDSVKMQVISNARSSRIYEILDRCREIVMTDQPGANVLKYLLYKMNNQVIKDQYRGEPCALLSNLYLSYGCIPFDCMPYCSSLLRHNPKIFDLFNSISSSSHEHELLARYVKNNTEVEGCLFTPKSEVEGFGDIDALVGKYNAALYHKHIERRIEEYKEHLYIKSYVDDSTKIIEELQELASSGAVRWAVSASLWLSGGSCVIDDGLKRGILLEMFANSHVALIYGSAGTGKSTLIKHLADFLEAKSKIFLADTHSAVDNMRRKVSASNSEYSTITSFLSRWDDKVDCDILFIDECSTVSNYDMQRVLEKTNFELLVLVGDAYQIESIRFGNWFSIARKFIPKAAVFELTHPYRATDANLLTIWDRVRKLDDAILEPLVKNGCVAGLDESVFERSEDDEIILCLNYDGLYGINNVNRFLQNSNPNRSVVWGVNTYKVGDPVLFNESSRFSPLVHNNSRGRIVDIRMEDQRVWFNIEMEELINENDALAYDSFIVGRSAAGKPVISVSVDKYRSTDEDDVGNDSSIVPFQVSYAISIHKAQGLEYDSVKIIITNEVEERITHSIFYTAITRARKRLKIYWSPETERSILERFKIRDCNRDANLLASFSSFVIEE